MEASASALRRLWLMLPARPILFILFQALFAAGYLLAGSAAGPAAAWDASAAWWPATVVFGNLVCLLLLTRFYRQEGCSYWDLFRIDRAHIKGDLLALLGLLVITGPVAMLPNTLLARALFGDAMVPMYQFIVPLPGWAAYVFAVVLFPITQGLTELAFYFLYLMPRLAALTRRPWLAYALACLALGLQHLAIPLRLDPRFIAWRGLMFIPFAFFIGLILKWRPRLLPYVALIHALMDLGTGLMVLTGF